MGSINWTGQWNSTNTYNVGDAVSYLGSSYIAVANSTNVIPSSSESAWNLLAAQGSVGPAGTAGVPGAPGASASPLSWTTQWGGITGTLSDQADLETALDAKADASSVPTKTSQLTNDAGFITSAEAAPVQSVAGKTGDVTLTYSDISGLSTVAHSGSYSDLSNTPTIPPAPVNADWDASSGAAEILNKPTIPTVPTDVSAFTNDAGYLTASSTVPAAHVTGLATVSTSGSYSDLTDKPTIPTSTSQLTNNSGFITDASVPTTTSELSNNSGFITSAEAPVQSVAGRTGAVVLSYSDLSDTPTIPAAQVNSDWNASSGVAEILNKPTLFTAADITAGENVTVTPNGDGVVIAATGGSGTTEAVWGEITGTLSSQTDLETALNAKANTASLATVATSGSYTDLENKPTIPVAQVNADWDASSGVAEILNKPTIPTVPTDVSAFTNDAGYLTASSSVAAAKVIGLATVATSGSYSDLSNKPTIPAAQMNSDWDAASGAAEILNKPSLATVATSGSYDDLSGKPTIPAAVAFEVNGTAAGDQALVNLVAGSNVTITDNGSGSLTIASTGGGGEGGATEWGSITGTLSSQTDLESALNAKANTSSLATVATSGSYTDLTNQPTIPTVPGAFTATAAGLAPASGGGTSNFLRADGTWTTPQASTILLDVSVGSSEAVSVQNAGVTFTVILMPTVNTDTADGWNASTSTYTIPVTGDYLIVSKLRVQDGYTSGISYGQGVNTSLADGPYFAWFVTVSAPESLQSRNSSINTRIMRCNAGDQLQMFAYGDNSQGISVQEAGLNIVFLGS